MGKEKKAREALKVAPILGPLPDAQVDVMRKASLEAAVKAQHQAFTDAEVARVKFQRNTELAELAKKAHEAMFPALRASWDAAERRRREARARQGFGSRDVRLRTKHHMRMV